MKYVDAMFHRVKDLLQGWTLKVGVVCVGAVLLFTPVAAKAGAITQGEFLGWLAAATGEADGLNTTVELVAWAQDKGLNPDGGWDPSAVLTKEVLAQTLVQLFNLNPKKYGGDLVKNLLREGIVLPSADELTLEDLIGVVDQYGMQGKLAGVYTSPGSGVQGDNGHPGNIVPPGFRNPRNPHFGMVPDDVPGHVGLGPRNRGGNGNGNR